MGELLFGAAICCGSRDLQLSYTPVVLQQPGCKTTAIQKFLDRGRLIRRSCDNRFFQIFY